MIAKLKVLADPKIRLIIGCFLIVFVPSSYGLITDGLGYEGLPTWFAWLGLIMWIYFVVNYVFPKNLDDLTTRE